MAVLQAGGRLSPSPSPRPRGERRRRSSPRSWRRMRWNIPTPRSPHRARRRHRGEEYLDDDRRL